MTTTTTVRTTTRPAKATRRRCFGTDATDVLVDLPAVDPAHQIPGAAA